MEIQRNRGTDAFQFHFEWTGVLVCQTDNETGLSNSHEKGNPGVSHKHPRAKMWCFHAENRGRGHKLEEIHIDKLTGPEIAFRALGDAGYTSGPDLLWSPEASGLTKTVRVHVWSLAQAQETSGKFNLDKKIWEFRASTGAKNRPDAPRNTNTEYGVNDHRPVEKIWAWS